MKKVNISVRFAAPSDTEWCQSRDGLVSGELVRRKVTLHELVVVEADGDRAGFLRLGFLWSTHPHIEMIWVEKPNRGKGLGRALLEFVEHVLLEQGHKILLSSSQANEPASQAWHRAHGFHECGYLAGINDIGVGEVFFSKHLS